jgi:putative intracellular protease/amidase
MKKKILFVLTSHGTKGSTGQPTGYYLGEVSHPWKEIKDAGYEIDFVSPKGGELPVDGYDLTDVTNKELVEDKVYSEKLKHTLLPKELVSNDYAGVFYAGGHGTMWDFPNMPELDKLSADLYSSGGVIAAVCHGPSGLVNIQLPNGKYLVDGKKVNSFTNEEEEAVGLTKIVPFLLEDKLKSRGAIFRKSDLWQEHVEVDERLITGQNPQSAKKVGIEIVKLLHKISGN